jgi:hypothetical protein
MAVAAWSGAAVYSWVAAGFASFTWQATVAVLLAGAGVIGLGLLSTTPRLPAPDRIGRRAALVWSVPVLAFCVLEVTDDVLGSTPAHPTLSTLLDPALAHHPVRAAAFLAWLVAGWQLIRR